MVKGLIIILIEIAIAIGIEIDRDPDFDFDLDDLIPAAVDENVPTLFYPGITVNYPKRHIWRYSLHKEAP